MVYRFVLMCCLALLCSAGHAARVDFVTVSPEPKNHAWWLRAQYHPFGKAVRGIPVKLLSKHWCYANEFTADLFPSEYMKEIEPDLSFAIEGHFGTKRRLTALVGAFETCSREKGMFLLVLEQRKGVKIVRFLEQYDFQNSLMALRSAEGNDIELWWCSSCDNMQKLEWNQRQKRFVWRQTEDLEESGESEQ